METIKRWIASRIQSKKFTVWLSAIIATLTVKYLGIELSSELIGQMIGGITSIYLLSQGYADGKSNGATSGVVEGNGETIAASPALPTSAAPANPKHI